MINLVDIVIVYDMDVDILQCEHYLLPTDVIEYGYL